MCLGTSVCGHNHVWSQKCLGTKRIWALTYLGTKVCGHKRVGTIVWAQACMGTNVSGHKRMWTQKYMGTTVCGRKRMWAQMCVGTSVSGHNRVSSSMYGHKRVVSIYLPLITYKSNLLLRSNFITECCS